MESKRKFLILGTGLLITSAVVTFLVLRKSGTSPRSRARKLMLRMSGGAFDQSDLTMVERCKILKSKIYKLVKNNSSIISQPQIIRIQREFGIDFAISFPNRSIPSSQQQPNLQSLNQQAEQSQNQKSSAHQKQHQATTFRQSDVFLKPFEPGICIEESLCTKHRLLFNKYPSWNHHVLVITKEAEPQGHMLTIEDFKASLIAMKALDEAVVVYNSGHIAGASQNHKNLQVIPVSSFPNQKIPINERVIDAFSRSQVSASTQLNQGNKDLGLITQDGTVGSIYPDFDAIKVNLATQANYDTLSERSQLHQARARASLMFILPEFQHIQHIFKKIDPQMLNLIQDEASLERVAAVLEKSYKACLSRLQNSGAHGAYNFVVTKEWIMMVNRQRPYYGNSRVPINSLGYLGLLNCKNQQQMEEISGKSPLEVLTSLAMPNVPGRTDMMMSGQPGQGYGYQINSQRK